MMTDNGRQKLLDFPLLTTLGKMRLHMPPATCGLGFFVAVVFVLFCFLGVHLDRLHKIFVVFLFMFCCGFFWLLWRKRCWPTRMLGRDRIDIE